MVIKTNRRYTLSVEKTSGGFLTIELPFTLEIVIERNLLSSVNNGVFRIYNLSEDNRNQLQKNATQLNLRKSIELKAGYGDNLYTIFSGNVLVGFSTREGSNTITELVGFDGGHSMTNAAISKTLQAGTSNKDVVETLIKEMEKFGVTRGHVGNIKGSSIRGVSLSGNPYELLKEYTDNQCYIDNKIVNVLAEDEFISGSIPVISSETGLLETPRVESTRVSFHLLFEPRITIGQKVLVKSTTQRALLDDRELKVLSLRHNGIFSDSVSGTMTTDIGGLVNPDIFKEVTR